DMETQAREALNAIGQEMDIVPERLQGSFTQMASFAKTSGLDTAEALDLTSRATRAAADGAAFYDKSIESVTESLQSFLKGNFANDAALGISATETTRNAAANK
ncbi:phage tail tape measure protein, partial [Streptococcus pneumoniae]|nr:phage tail tape measure protein [Streptococcus pneumoniae]